MFGQKESDEYEREISKFIAGQKESDEYEREISKFYSSFNPNDNSGEIPSDDEEKSVDNPDDDPDEDLSEITFNPNEDIPDEDLDEELFDPNEDVPDEDLDEELFDPNDDTPDEDLNEELFDPNDDAPDEDLDEELFDPNDDALDEDLDEELFDSNEVAPDETPEEINNPSNLGTITVAIPEQPEQTPEQESDNEHEQELDNEHEIDNEQEPERDWDVVTPEGEQEKPGESAEVIEIRADLEDWGYPSEPDEDYSLPEQELDQASDNETDSVPENEPEQEPEQDVNLINPETGEPVPKQVNSDMIPLEDKIESIYREKQEIPDEEIGNEPEQEPENDSKIELEEKPEISILDQEKSDLISPEQEPELHPEQEAEVTPEQEPIKSQKQKQVKVKKVELITEQEELDNYELSENEHIIGTKFWRPEQEPEKKPLKKTKLPNELKKKSMKVNKVEGITEYEESGEPEEKLKDTNKAPQTVQKKIVEQKEKDSEKEKQTIESEEVIVKKPKSKQQTVQQIEVKVETKNQETEESAEKTKTEQIERYRQETGKRPFYKGKKTKSFLEWLEKQKKIISKKQVSSKEGSKDDWEITLEKWIREADVKEVPETIKKEILEKIREFRKLRELNTKLLILLQKENLSKSEIVEVKSLIKKIEKMITLQEEIFENLRAFERFYNKNIHWFEYQIEAERDKFTIHLAQKLEYLKKIEITQNFIKKNWQEILKENLYNNISLSLNEKSLINKILQKEELTDSDEKELIFILCKLPTEELVSLLGEIFRLHTQNYVKWGWDYDVGVKRLMLKEFLKRMKFETTSHRNNAYHSFTAKAQGKIEIPFYSVAEFFRDLKREIRRITGQKINYRTLSKKFLKMKSKWHVNDKILNSKDVYSIVLPWNLIKLYETRLKETLSSDFKQVEMFFNKIRKFKRYISSKEVMNFNKDYFKSLNTKTKAYFYGWLLAEGHLDKKCKRLMVEINVRDAEIIKRFIEVLNINPKKANFRRTEKNGNRYMFLVLEISDEIFVKHLVNLGFIRGKKSNKIRFPLSIVNNRELALACLLGFFDGDGSHGKAFPKSLPEIERKYLRPFITSKSVRFLNDIKSIFNIRYKISGSKRLSIGTFLFIEMLENYKRSLDRKRYDGYLSSEELIKLRTENLGNSWSNPRRSFILDENELKSLWEKGWSDKKIANYHKKKYGIDITERTVKKWRLEWNLLHTDPIFKAAVKVNLIKKLLPLKEWTLEGIYTRCLGYTYNPSNSKHKYRLRKRLEKWFVNDPLIQSSSDIVERIKKIYRKKSRES